MLLFCKSCTIFFVLSLWHLYICYMLHFVLISIITKMLDKGLGFKYRTH